jgi:ATP-binding cassette subfamily B multidrug efflux pump
MPRVNRIGETGSDRRSRDEETGGKGIDKNSLRRLFAYGLPYWYFFVIALVLVLIVSVSELARPYLVKIAIDDYIQKAVHGDMARRVAEQGIQRLGLIFLLLIVIEFVFSYLHTYLLQYTGKRIIMNLREKIFNHIQRLPVTYFDKNPVGRIVTRITNDTDALNEMYTDVVVGFIQNVFVMGGIIVVMFSLNVRLTLLCFAVLPLMVVVTVFFRKFARAVFREIRTKLATINAFMSEHISGMKIIQVFNMQEKKYDEFDEINQDYYKATYKQVILFGIFRPFMDIVRSLGLALLLWYGGRNILQGLLEFGTLYAFTNYINQFFHPIMELTDKYNTMQGAIVASERIFNLLEEPQEPEPVEKPVVLDRVRGEIEFRNVWFAYVGEEWVLKDVSFKILPGQSVAFVGATGAGKTSIINLICGFYEIQKGEILIDGQNIKDIPKQVLRRNIGLVLQDVFLFSGDIETNIKLFRSDISQEKVKEVAEYVNAHTFIEKLPEGYRHPVTEKGSTLSTGQRQLLSFARALISDPAILVMDEATSNIDTETEILIQEALQKLMKGRTTIAIAHRLSTIQKADKIIVIHKGEIREMGTHQELLEREGLYYNLYRLQYKEELEESQEIA